MRLCVAASNQPKGNLPEGHDSSALWMESSGIYRPTVYSAANLRGKLRFAWADGSSSGSPHELHDSTESTLVKENVLER